jgi:hypothetical protein
MERCMPAERKATIRQLAVSAYETGLGVAQGVLRHNTDDATWRVGERDLNKWLEDYDGQEIVVVVASLEDDRPMEERVCRTCGTEYVGLQCPRCREARRRLRGR